MIDENKVFAQFCLYAGLSLSAAKDWLPLCQGAIQKIGCCLAPGADVSDPRLILAAAAESYYQYSLCRTGTNAQSISIGDISVSDSSGASGTEAICRLREEALAAASDLLTVNSMCFRQV